MSESSSPRILVIGAGVAGITALHVLHSRGYTDVTVMEKGADVGGVWYWNHYPGLTCDVPSHIYQFGFAPKPDWTHVWADGPQIQQYHRDVVNNLGLSSHIRLNTEVTSAQWDAETATWSVTTASGQRDDYDIVICATGVLHHPSIPDIAGLDDFTGPVVHTARWDDDLVTADTRIAVIGTGSTGVQVVSALQREAAHVYHFVRSPQWTLWAPMRLRQVRLVTAALRRLPGLNRALHRTLLRGSAILADITTRPSWRRRLVQAYARLCLRMQVRDRRLRAALTPDYAPLCKRQVVSGTYYRAIQAANADLVTAPIAGVNAAGIRTVEGDEYPVDLIVLATGFAAHNYMRPMKVVGRDGLSIDDAWAAGPRAYRTLAIPGFPNLFTVLGPNSPTGSISLQYTAELTAGHIADLLDAMAAEQATTVEVTEQATTEFNRGVAAAMGPTVWNSGCDSWYFTDNGSIDLWPYSKKVLTALLAHPDRRHYTLTRSAAPTSTPGLR